MHVIKLDATPSTNQYLKQMALENHLNDYMVVATEKQTKGRGQMGAEWISEPGKNLTFSILKIFSDFKAHDQVYLNCAISLAVHDTLQELSVPNLKVKWPNDIMSGNKKLCGILVENILQGDKIGKSIIGIGLNVNQQNFGELRTASSLRLLLDKTFDLDMLMYQIIERIKIMLNVLNTSKMKGLKTTYEKNLYRKDKPSTFMHENGSVITGFIVGLSDEGRLIIKIEDAHLKEFSVKEIKLLN